MDRRGFLAFAGSAAVAAAWAETMRLSSGALADPFQLHDVVSASSGFRGKGNAAVAGRTFIHPGLVGGERTAIVLCVGQSNIANHASSLYTPTHAKVENLSIHDGGLYRAVDPLLGPTGTDGNWLGRFGDKLIDGDYFDRVILIPVGVGGTLASEWAAGGAANHRIGVAKRRSDALGYMITFVLYHQGEEDNVQGTTKATYKAGVSSTIGSCRDLGITAPIFIGKCSLVTYSNTSANVTDGQAELVDTLNGIYAGADSDSLSGPTYRADGTHFNATGADACAGLWRDVIADYIA